MNTYSGHHWQLGPRLYSIRQGLPLHVMAVDVACDDEPSPLTDGGDYTRIRQQAVASHATLPRFCSASTFRVQYRRFAWHPNLRREWSRHGIAGILSDSIAAIFVIVFGGHAQGRHAALWYNGVPVQYGDDQTP